MGHIQPESSSPPHGRACSLLPGRNLSLSLSPSRGREGERERVLCGYLRLIMHVLQASTRRQRGLQCVAGGSACRASIHERWPKRTWWHHHVRCVLYCIQKSDAFCGSTVVMHLASTPCNACIPKRSHPEASATRRERLLSLLLQLA